MSNDDLLQAIKDGFTQAGWMSPAEDVIRQIAFAVNNMEGRAANEAEKDARRKVVVEKINEIKFQFVHDVDFMKKIDSLIKEAQG